MANKSTTETLTCMNCGTPIKSGFFCAKCQSGENDDVKPNDGWKGSRFTGEAKKRRKQQLLMEDLARWGKTLLILVVIGGIGYGVYALFGDQIKTKIREAQNVTEQKDKYDPTKDKAIQDQEAAADGKTTNGRRAFTPRAGRGSIDGGPE